MAKAPHLVLQLSMVEHAAELARVAHHGQFRKWGTPPTPYVRHPARVASLVTLYRPVPELIAAAWLHDVVEDTTIPLDIIRKEFGEAVADLVGHLTNTSKDSGRNRAARKQMDRERLATIPPEAKLIKLCDRLDNLYESHHAPPDFLALFLTETRALVDVALRGTDADLEREILAVCDALESTIPVRETRPQPEAPRG